MVAVNSKVDRKYTTGCIYVLLTYLFVNSSVEPSSTAAMGPGSSRQTLDIYIGLQLILPFVGIRSHLSGLQNCLLDFPY